MMGSTEEHIKRLEDRINGLEKRVQKLERKSPAQAPAQNPPEK